MSNIHIPMNQEGQFAELQPSSGPGSFSALLDDGTLYGGGLNAIDHHLREIRWAFTYQTNPPSVETLPGRPEAVLFGSSPERRDKREPVAYDTETGEYLTAWVYQVGGAERLVTSFIGEDSQLITYDTVQPYDGEARREGVSSQPAENRYWDFQYQITYPVTNPDATISTVQVNALAYRPFSRIIYQSGTREVEVGVEGRFARGSLPIRREYSFTSYAKDPETQDLWVVLGSIKRQSFSGEEGPTEYEPGESVTTLRDHQQGPWQGQAADFPPLRFTSPNQLVKVEGIRSGDQADLEGCRLTAYGHTFENGTWAALRDNPVQRKNGSWDFSPLIILHEHESTVSAVRPGGSVQTCSRSVFEQSILRVPLGSFQRFSSVGSGHHSWPPQWAFAECGQTQAVGAFDPWRDCVAGPRPPNNTDPPHWYWPGRPKRRPAVSPAGAPVAPLGLTLADTMSLALHDDPYPKGQGPFLLPKQGNALHPLARRVLHQPSEWPEELEDKGVLGPVTLSFDLPPPPTEKEQWFGALLLRWKGPGTFELSVNGEAAVPLKLGHNAPNLRGWHPYVVEVNPGSTVTLSYSGKLSRALLCVRKFKPTTVIDT